MTQDPLTILDQTPSPDAWRALMGALMATDDLQAAVASSCDRLEGDAAWRSAAAWLPGPWFEVDKAAGELPAARVLRALGLASVPCHWIPPGTFLMGSPMDEPGRLKIEAQIEVTLTRGFLVGRAPVTRGQWAEVCAATGGPRPDPSPFPGTPEHPVEQVDWYEAVAFCNALSSLENLAQCYRAPDGTVYTWAHAEGRAEPEFAGLACEGWRLPTDAEWEYACRAGTTGAIYQGELEILGEHDAPALDPIAWYGGNSGVDNANAHPSSGWREMQRPATHSASHPVGLKAPNPWGMHDTLGNVDEWCQAGHRLVSKGPLTDPVIKTAPDKLRIRRGGSWLAEVASVRAASRTRILPWARQFGVGLRVARTLPLP